MVLKLELHLDSEKVKGWINEKDPYGWFQWYFRYWKGRRSKDDKRQISRWKRILYRFVSI